MESPLLSFASFTMTVILTVTLEPELNGILIGSVLLAVSPLSEPDLSLGVTNVAFSILVISYDLSGVDDIASNIKSPFTVVIEAATLSGASIRDVTVIGEGIL
ncbi:hypothetical protein D3C74_424540 [compost metagenome]